MQRRTDESFEDYKIRRAAANEETKTLLTPRVLFISKSYTRNEKGSLVANKGTTYKKS